MQDLLKCSGTDSCICRAVTGGGINSGLGCRRGVSGAVVVVVRAGVNACVQVVEAHARPHRFFERTVLTYEGEGEIERLRGGL